MTPQDFEELKQLIALQREMTRQRLRAATCEAWVDDVQQKMAINRAVYSAGYGIAPAGKIETVTSNTTNTNTVPLPAAPAATNSKAAKLAPYLLVAIAIASGVGIGAGSLRALTPNQPATSTTPTTEFPVYDVQAWRPE